MSQRLQKSCRPLIPVTLFSLILASNNILVSLVLGITVSAIHVTQGASYAYDLYQISISPCN